MDTKQIIEMTDTLIDALKATCSAYALSDDSSGYKIIVLTKGLSLFVPFLQIFDNY